MFYKKLTINGVEYDLAVNISGSGAPTVEGAVGLLYMDENNGDLYKCTAIGVWKKVDDAEAKQKADEALSLATEANSNALEAKASADEALPIAREARETANEALKVANNASYVLTEADKSEIVNMVLAELPNGDEVGY